jgi:hypothetical protein
MNRDKIIQKLNALRNTAYDKSIKDTPEALNALNLFSKLMEKYNLTLTDLEVKSIPVTGMVKKTNKSTDFMHQMVVVIADITNTEVIRANKDEYLFLGVGADIAYANWIYDLVANSLETCSTIYKIGLDYHKLINSGHKGQDVMEAYKQGYIFAVINTLESLKAVATGNALVPVKNELITKFMDDNGIQSSNRRTKAIKIAGDKMDAVEAGYSQGRNVKVRQEIN